MLSSGIAYTKLLTEHVIKKADESEVVVAQKANPKVDILTGLPFKSQIDKMTDEEKATEFITTSRAKQIKNIGVITNKDLTKGI
jgi:hypothetical protein